MRRLAGGVIELSPLVSNQDKRYGRSTYRQRIVTALEHFALLAEEVGQAAEFGLACEAFATQLRGRWTTEECTLKWSHAFDFPDLDPH